MTKDFTVFKGAMIIATKICIIWFLVLSFFPFVPVVWGYAYGAFVVVAHEIIVKQIL